MTITAETYEGGAVQLSDADRGGALTQVVVQESMQGFTGFSLYSSIVSIAWSFVA